VRHNLNTRPAFTLIELLVVVAIVGVLATLTVAVAQQALLTTSLATSAANIRQLSAGAVAYLADNEHRFWLYRRGIADPDRRGVEWWYGFEAEASLSKPEGKRTIDMEGGPLAGYIPGGISADPSFRYTGKPFKPKYDTGHIGVGYNVVLGGGWLGRNEPMKYWDFERPGEVVVFATSAQVNTFQAPASSKNPMIEEFYGFDEKETSIHFRHRGRAMVAFANGSAGFLDIDESTRDKRAPEANVGRFAPKGSFLHLR